MDKLIADSDRVVVVERVSLRPFIPSTRQRTAVRTRLSFSSTHIARLAGYLARAAQAFCSLGHRTELAFASCR